MLINAIRDPDYLNYLKKDGTRPLTANWPAGNFTITLGKVTFTGVGSLPGTAVVGQVVFLTTDQHLYLGVQP